MTAYDRLADTAVNRAEEIFDLPPDDREARYAALRTEHFATAGVLGIPDHAARELVDELERAIRRLVAAREANPSGPADPRDLDIPPPPPA